VAILTNPLPTVQSESPCEIRDRVNTRRWRVADGAAVITIVVLFAMAATMFLPLRPSMGLNGVNAEQIEMYHMVDVSSQRLSYRVGMLLLALLCILGAATITNRANHPRFVTENLRTAGKLVAKWLGVLLALVMVLALVLDIQGMVYAAPEGRKWRLSFWLASICLVLLLKPRKTRAFAVAIWGFIAAYGFFLVGPGLARIPFLFEPLLSDAELHYSMTLAQGDRLATGLRLGSQVNLNYGLIHSLALAVFERNSGLLSFGEHLRLVQAFQIAFLLVALSACYLWRPANPLFMLFSILLIGPWLSTSQPAIYFPNQSGWRSFAFAAGIAILLLVYRQPLGRVAFALGAAAGFLLLYNPETGLCLSLGYGLFLLSRRRSATLFQIAAVALRAAGGAAVVLLGVVIFYRVGLGTWPPLSTVLLVNMRRYAQGFGGLPLYFDPLAVLIFAHSTYVVSSTVLKWRLRDLGSDESIKLAIAAVILTWFVYYLNRPDPWNLWTYQFLYLFLIADIFDPRFVRGLRRRGIVAATFDLRLASLTLVLVPVLLANNLVISFMTLYPTGEATATTAISGISMPEPEAKALYPTAKATATAAISGISMPEPVAKSLRAQADFLSSQEALSTWFFSRHSYSLSLLTRRFNPLPFQDLFGEISTDADFEALVADIFSASPRVILFDAPDFDPVFDSIPSIYWRTGFYGRLQIRLAEHYQRGPITSGWQVWQLRLPPAQAAAIQR
jgi:hypothetical protein